MEDKIKELKRKRDNLNIRIRDYVVKGKNAYPLVVDFNDITKELNKLGCKVFIGSDVLKLENWKDGEYVKNPNPTPQTKSSNSSNSSNSSPQPSTTHHWILNLAWTEKKEDSELIQIQKVKEFFKELCLTKIACEKRQVNSTTIEYILKYEYCGTEDAFRLLKSCTQFMLDSFAETDYDKFNIAIYGKKKPQ